METSQLRTFVESTLEYFEKITGVKAVAGVPRTLEDTDDFLSEITGAIGIAGDLQGAIYITGKEAFFSDLLAAFNPKAERSRDNILDAAGELANTVAGNGQRSFGSSMRISVPMIITGKNPQIRMREPRFVIPIDWQGHSFALVVGMNDERR